MGRRRAEPSFVNRRQFLRQVSYAVPAIFPTPFRLGGWPNGFHGDPTAFAASPEATGEFRLKPDYPSPSPLDEMLRMVAPGADEYPTERYAAELQKEFDRLREMVTSPHGARASELAQ